MLIINLLFPLFVISYALDCDKNKYVKGKTTVQDKHKGSIPITKGDKAVLTYFTDTVFQCTDQHFDYGVAVNPLLLGFTLEDWINRFANSDSSNIPWCGKKLKLQVNGKMFIGTIIDTCNPGDSGAFVDPNTGKIIGGKCDYANVIDLHGERGLQFLRDTVGDDFYDGDVEWEIFE